MIQIATANKYKSLNFIRNRYVLYNSSNFLIHTLNLRPDVEDLKLELKTLGATEVFTYDELNDPSFKQTWASIRGVSGYIELASNTVPSPSSTGKPRQTRPKLRWRPAYSQNGHPSRVSCGFHQHPDPIPT